MSLLIQDDELSEKWDEIWKEVSKSIKKKLDIEVTYNEKYMKAEIKTYKWKFNTNIHNNKIPKEVSQYIYLSIILINFVLE